MKGFTVTPVVLISIILIVGFMLIHFSTIDFWIADSIKQEGEIKKLQNLAFKDMTIGTASFYPAIIKLAQILQGTSELTNSIQDLASSADFTASVRYNDNNIFVTYAKSYDTASAVSRFSDQLSHDTTISYPFQRLVNAYNSISFPYTPCSSAEGAVRNSLPSGIEWRYSGPYFSCTSTVQCCGEDGCWSECSIYSYEAEFESSYIKNTLSEKYIHSIGSTKSGTCWVSTC
ncbi:MAG TPA: hypothetical protein VJH90_01910 [archaeon]|nr:hypothetical protein [archaeon]